MKKLIFLLSFLLVGIVSIAQERTVLLNGGVPIDLATTKYFAYAGTPTDYLLATTRDTIEFVLLVKNPSFAPINFYSVSTMSPIAGADTTVALSVDYKVFNTQAYSVLIASALTSAITAEVQTVKTSLGVTNTFTRTTASAVDLFRGTKIANNDTLTVSPRIQTDLLNPVLFFKYLRFRYIIKGNDSVGTGIKITRFEIQFYN